MKDTFVIVRTLNPRDTIREKVASYSDAFLLVASSVERFGYSNITEIRIEHDITLN